MPSTSNCPNLGDIQKALGLEGNEQLWTSIRESATELLKKAGILLLSATDSAVQHKKRLTASELERMYPAVFGLVDGEARDQSLQKETSYGILTSAMDTAKRGQKKQNLSGGTSKAPVREALPKSPTNHKSPVSPAPPSSTPSPSASRPRPSAGGSIRPPAPLRLDPKPFAPVGVSFPSASALTPSTMPGPIAMESLVLTFIFEAGDIYSPMRWSDLVLDGENIPKLAKVHENLLDDGLQVDIHSYTIQSPEGHLIRSDRALNCKLELYAENGVKRSDWRIVLN
ncbi:hypothetical protein Q9L58_010655, partial [Maublancomyces gigas]